MRTILVTGSAKGLGKELILKFAKEGYNLIINYKNSKKEAYELKKYILEKYKTSVLIIKCDITKEKEVKNMIDKSVNTFKNIDILINNASLSLDDFIENKNIEDFKKVLNVNIIGTFLVTREVIKKCNVKNIINISSTDSINTYNDISLDYCISKAGINMMTKIFKQKYKNIDIYAVAPNWMNTESIRNMNQEYLREEMKRIGQKKLIEPVYVANLIYDIISTKKYKDCDIIKIEEGV